MIFGKAVDMACEVWSSILEEKDTHSGNCLLYDNALLSRNITGLLILLKTLSIILFYCASLSYRPIPESLSAQKKLPKEDAVVVATTTTRTSAVPSVVTSPPVTAAPPLGQQGSVSKSPRSAQREQRTDLTSPLKSTLAPQPEQDPDLELKGPEDAESVETAEALVMPLEKP